MTKYTGYINSGHNWISVFISEWDSSHIKFNIDGDRGFHLMSIGF